MPRRSPLPVLLALPLLLTCRSAPLGFVEEGETIEMLRHPEEIIVLVETAGPTFRARPRRAVLTDPSQTITWVALDPDVRIEVEWKDPASIPPPPPEPCAAPARQCGGMNVNRPPGTRERHYYTIRGTKGGAPMDPLDPEVIIFY